MPLVQDRLFDLLTSSPARYHCTTDAPFGRKQKCTPNQQILMNYYINPHITHLTPLRKLQIPDYQISTYLHQSKWLQWGGHILFQGYANRFLSKIKLDMLYALETQCQSNRCRISRCKMRKHIAVTRIIHGRHGDPIQFRAQHGSPPKIPDFRWVD